MLITLRVLLILWGAVKLYIMILSIYVHIYLQTVGCCCQWFQQEIMEAALNKHTCKAFIFYFSQCLLRAFYGVASLVAQMVKNLPAVQETRVQSLSREDL